jgi:hypothetical protein
METVSVDGVIYTKASSLARKFRYTPDYIGQLCRAGKADCQLVGRSWYVSESSLIQYKDTRYRDKSTRGNEITSFLKSKTSTEITSVYPRLKRTTAKQLHVHPVAVHEVGGNTIKYFADETESLPLLRAKDIVTAPEKEVQAAPAVVSTNSVAINVRQIEKPQFNLDFTPLPKVVLQGTVPVVSVDEVTNEIHKQQPLAVTLADLPVHATSSAPIAAPETLGTASVVRPSTPRTRLEVVPELSVASDHYIKLWPILLVAFFSAGCFCAFLLSTTSTLKVSNDRVSASVMFLPETLISVFLP